MKNFVFCLAFFGSAFAFADEVLEKLNSLPSVSAQETTNESDKVKGYRRFSMTIEQPTDHSQPTRERFKQKLVLFHKNFNEPMVLQTSGYLIFSEKLSRLAAAFETNQIQVEHRFFAGSVPASKAWSKLTIEQSAADFHHIVTTFKQIYANNWVNTGASKGGMTSIFHRRFYPDDFNGTLADVAPVSNTIGDLRYVDFVNNVGGKKYADCRAQLESLQKSALKKREQLEQMMDGTFNQLGSKDVGLEHSILEMPFTFWQYTDPENGEANCKNIPGAQASVIEIFQFLKKANDMSQYSDEQILQFQPYFYQAAYQLGMPELKRSHLIEQLLHPYTVKQYLPKGEDVEFQIDTMRDIQSWVTQKSRGMMFVYGELDPWTAGAFRDVNNDDNHYFVIKGGNHKANFTMLTGDESKDALETLGRWLNKTPSTSLSFMGDSLEDDQFYLRPRL